MEADGAGCELAAAVLELDGSEKLDGTDDDAFSDPGDCWGCTNRSRPGAVSPLPAAADASLPATVGFSKARPFSSAAEPNDWSSESVAALEPLLGTFTIGKLSCPTEVWRGASDWGGCSSHSKRGLMPKNTPRPSSVTTATALRNDDTGEWFGDGLLSEAIVIRPSS